MSLTDIFQYFLITVNFYKKNQINKKGVNFYSLISSGEITLKYINDDGEEIKKNIKLTLTASELYVAKKNGKEKFYDKGVGGEIILKTKEAGTIHIWYSEGHYSNNQQVKVWIEGLGEVDFDELVYYLG